MRSILVALVQVAAFPVAHAATSSNQPHFHEICPSATINYITQTLPQQCLRTDWPRSTGTPYVETAPDGGSKLNPTDIARGGDAGGTIEAHTIGSTYLREPDATGKITSADSPSASSAGLNSAGLSPESAVDDESDPLSDQGNFLSFEEWKAQVLEKAGQSPDHVVGAAGGASRAGDSRRRATGISNALDSLGDEGEIELDFSGFVNPDPSPKPAQELLANGEPVVGELVDEIPAPPAKRSKDAGTTSNERFNYASFDCAATVLKTNQGSKGAIRILSENKDNYLINKCADQEKYFIVELCNDILIDTIVLGNFEFFSSTFRTFRVSISDRYPVKAEKWREIGTFEARNTRGVQAFMVEDGLIWARYLKVELLTHYGKEYYCPVSLLRVHGTTMMDDYRNEMKDPHDQDDEEEENALMVEPEGIAAPAEVIPIAPIKSVETQVSEAEEVVTVISTVSSHNADTQNTETTSFQDLETDSTPPASDSSEIFDPNQPSIDSCETRPSGQTLATTPPPTAPPVLPRDHQQAPVPRSEASSPAPPAASSDGSYSSPLNATMTIPPSPMALTNVTGDPSLATDSANMTSLVASPQGESTVAGVSTASPDATEKPVVLPQVATLASPDSVTSGSQDQTNTQAAAKAHNVTVVGTKTKTKQASPIKASLATPATQDSFFRSVHKRLQMLEANSTLSLQYIEEQSRILRDAFAKAEKKQMQKTSKFLETLNSTVLGELQNIRLQYDQLWQSTVLEFASQKQQNQQEIRALGERFSLLADELVWMKRMQSLMLFLIVTCLGLVIINVVGGTAVPLEPDFLQSIQHLRRGVSGMSSVSFSKQYPNYIDSDPGTPSRPTSMGGMFARKANHRRHGSDGITSGEEATNPASSPEQHRTKQLHVRMNSDATTLTSGRRSKSPSVSFEVDTPSSEHDEVLNSTSGAEAEVDVPEADPLALKRAASSPPLGRLFEVPTDDEMSSSGPADNDPKGRNEMG